MLPVLLLTVGTSAADSLNPMGIAQQFILQGLVKKKHHIWAYIISMGSTNFIGGLIVYFGAGALIQKYMDSILDKYSNIIYIGEFVLGILVLMSVLFLLMKSHTKKLQKEILVLKGESSDDDTDNSVSKIKSVNLVSLSLFGMLSTIMELTTALPYFAFLAILLTYKLPISVVILILILYNIIYSSPLIVLYFLYVKCQSKFDELYVFLKNKVTKYAEILSPILVGVVGVILISHGLNSLFTLV